MVLKYRSKSVRAGALESVLRVVADACSHGLVMTRHDMVIHANPAYLEMTGRSLAELRGTPVRKLISARPAAKRVTLKTDSSSSSIRSAESIAARQEISRLDFNRAGERLALLLMPNPRRRRFIANGRDQKLEPLGRLVGGITHDFNNVLTAICLYTELLLENGENNAAQRAYLDQVRSAADQGRALIRQLLAFARQQPTKPQVLSLNTIALGMRDMLRRLVGENIKLEFNCAQELGCVRADPAQMQEVLLNLVTNARDALPQGGHILVTTRSYAAPTGRTNGHHSGKFVSLSVADDGHGMSREIQEQLFEPFFSTKGGRGTGLGLSTVYGIVAQSHGDILVDSAPGKGTKITIVLPRVRGIRSPIPEPSLSETAAHAGDETVLVAEDEDNVRLATARMLRQCGFRPLVARNGKDALRKAQQHRGLIHLLITDLVMPGMSGEALATALGRQRPATKVLFVSGYPRRPIRGGGAFLSKPFTRSVLVRKIREVLDQPASPPGLPGLKREAVCKTEP